MTYSKPGAGGVPAVYAGQFLRLWKRKNEEAAMCSVLCVHYRKVEGTGWSTGVQTAAYFGPLAG